MDSADQQPGAADECQNCVLFENTGTATLIIEADMTISMVNDHLLKMFGYSREELLANRCFLDFMTPEYRELAKHYHELTLSNQIEAPKSLECRLIDQSGRIRDVLAEIGWIAKRRQAIISIIDLTERNSAENERHNLSQIVEQSPESILLTDVHGKILYANAAFEALSGYDRREIIDQTIDHPFFSDEDRFIYKKMSFSVSCGEAGEHRTRNTHKSGRVMTTATRIMAISNLKGRVAHLVCAKKDITREMELEQQLYQSQKMETIGTMASGIAHDFNNIVAGILGYAEITLQVSGDNERIGRYMRSILQACERASDLAMQVLSLGRKKEQEHRPILIQSVVGEALELLRVSTPAQTEFRKSLQAAGSLVLADPARIHQIIINLCTNAAEAMEPKGGLLEIKLVNIDLPASNSYGAPAVPTVPHVRLSVRDTGAGIDQEILDRIFEPYFTTRATRGGTGLGLSVVESLVKNIGGFIKVRTQIASGTTFEVYLPRFIAQASSEPTEGEILPRGHESILVVDDELFILEVLRDMLSGLGYRVETTEGVQFMLERMRKDPNRYDLVIADMNMPHLTGRQLALEMLKRIPEVPVILCSGLGIPTDEFKEEHPNIKALLTKPIQYGQLAQTVRQTLDSSAIPRQQDA